MTREEAVNRLEDYKNVMIESIPSDKMQEALNMAIEALKNQEAEKEQIIKELEERITPTISSETYSANEAFRTAIYIVKRGGKE